MSGISRGSRLEGKEGAPSYPLGANPVSPGIGNRGRFTFPIRAAHSGSQPPSFCRGEETLGLPCALAPQRRPFVGASLSPFSNHPLLQPRSRAATFEVQAGAWRRDGPTLRLSLCTGLALAPPARPPGSLRGSHIQGNLLPGVPCRAHPSSWPELGRARTPLPSSPPAGSHSPLSPGGPRAPGST